MNSLRLLLVAGSVAFAASAFGQAARNNSLGFGLNDSRVTNPRITTGGTIVFVQPRNRSEELARSRPTIDEGSRTGGVIPRAARAGNPLELINPFAPYTYGSGEKMFVTGPAQGTQTPGEEERPKVFKLFAYEF